MRVGFFVCLFCLFVEGKTGIIIEMVLGQIYDQVKVSNKFKMHLISDLIKTTPSHTGLHSLRLKVCRLLRL